MRPGYAEADAVCGAPYGESSPKRTNTRNGCRHREFGTRAGTLDVAIPKLREGSYFPDSAAGTPPPRRAGADHGGRDLLPARRRHAADGETRGRPRGITRLSKSQVSLMAAELDAQVAEFCGRPLDQDPYTFVAADVLVLKVREGGRVVYVHALVATPG